MTVEDGSVRLIAGSGILAVYTAILYPRGRAPDAEDIIYWSKEDVGPKVIISITITGTPDGTKYLRDDGSWQTVATGGGTVTVTGIDRQRSVGLDPFSEGALQRVQATLSVPAIPSTRTRRRFAVAIR